MNAPLSGEEQPVSAAVLERLNKEGAITIAELASLWSIAEHSVYPYFVDRVMSYDKLRQLFRHAKDPRVRDAVLTDLLPGTGYIAQHVEASLDVDGDGDVDTDDAVASAVDQIGVASESLKSVHQDEGLEESVRLLDQLIAAAVRTRRIQAWRIDQKQRRRKLRPAVLGMENR
ncbi:MAG: hypothetical protein AAF333_13225 [Planctomycetota bacterium]